MTTEYKAALEAINNHTNGRHATMLDDDVIETIRRALLIADRLMQEPSDGMVEAGKDYFDQKRDLSGWEAMRDQLIKEAEGV